MKVVQELVAYFDRRGRLTKKQIRHLLDQGLLAADAPLTMIDLCDPVGATYYFRVTGEAAGPLWGTDVYTGDSAIARRRTYYFLVTGEAAGPLWGTDVYTGDSAIAVAAVHAGLVKAGESAIVKITVEQPLPRYAGSLQHGVASHEFGPYGTAYRLAAV